MNERPPVDLPRMIEYGLASTWLLCLVLTVMDGFTPVEMVSHTLRAGAHCGAVLLFVYPVSRLLGGFGLTKKLIVGLAKLLAGAVVLTYVSLIIWPLGALIWPVIGYAHYFFFGPNPWRTEYIHFQRGPEFMVSQERYVDSSLSGRRTVWLTPITPLLQWVRPVPPAPPAPAGVIQHFAYDLLSHVGPRTPGYAGWTRVGAAHQNGIHRQDSAASQRLLAGRRSYDQAEQRRSQAEQRRLASQTACERLRGVEDSLLQRGRLPALRLPALTRYGANSCGFRLGQQLWRNHLIDYTDDTGCAIQGARGYWNRSRDLVVGAQMHWGTVDRAFNLVIPHVTKPGTYQLAPHGQTRTNDESSFTENLLHPTWYVSAGVEVRISRFDTVARVASGTFQGNLYRFDALNKKIPLQQGRFDVKF